MKWVALVAALTAMPTAAVAAGFPVDGAYGTKDGCAADAQGLRIAPDYLSAPELSCEGFEVKTAKNGYTARCALEDTKPFVLRFSVAKKPDGSLTYRDNYFAKESVILAPCR